MAKIIPVTFPPGAILDRDGFVWATLPPGTAISCARILGTCSIDPSTLALVQVTVEQLHWGVELISQGQIIPFPVAGSTFDIAVVGLEQHDVRAVSTFDAPVRVSVHVRRMSGGAERDAHGRLLRLPEPITFQLVLLARGAEEKTF